MSIDEIEASAELAMQHDYQLAIQGIGDRAYRELLNIYEAAFEKYPERADRRWRIEQAQVIHPDDVSRTVVSVPDEEILGMEIVMTVLGGKVRFRDGAIVR